MYSRGPIFRSVKICLPKDISFILIHSGKLVPCAAEVLFLDKQIKLTNTFVLRQCKMRSHKFLSFEGMSGPFGVHVWLYTVSMETVSWRFECWCKCPVASLVLLRMPCVNGNINVLALVPLSPLTLGETLTATTLYTQ